MRITGLERWPQQAIHDERIMGGNEDEAPSVFALDLPRLGEAGGARVLTEIGDDRIRVVEF